MNNVRLSLKNWEALLPDETGFNKKLNLAFLSSKLRRRLSDLTCMAISTAHHCAPNQLSSENTALVFCSKYGEIKTTTNILTGIAKKKLVSPASFSQSVHNSPASFFTIVQKLHSHATTVSAGDNSLECAFIEAWSIVQMNNVDNILLVYYDELLPEIYPIAPSNIKKACVFAIHLAPCDENVKQPHLQLSWGTKYNSDNKETVGDMLRLLQSNAGCWEKSTPDLKWVWRIIQKKKANEKN